MTNPIDPKMPSKAQQVEKLLKRSRGATMAELMTETSWQAHSVRTFLTSLRKKGHSITKEERKPGVVAYRIGAPATDAPSPAKGHTGDAASEASA
jgi:predicted transcriptional regulator